MQSYIKFPNVDLCIRFNDGVASSGVSWDEMSRIPWKITEGRTGLRTIYDFNTFYNEFSKDSHMYIGFVRATQYQITSPISYSNGDGMLINPSQFRITKACKIIE